MISSDIVHFVGIFGKMDDELKSIIILISIARKKNEKFSVFFFQNFKTNHNNIIILQLEFLI